MWHMWFACLCLTWVFSGVHHALGCNCSIDGCLCQLRCMFVVGMVFEGVSPFWICFSLVLQSGCNVNVRFERNCMRSRCHNLTFRTVYRTVHCAASAQVHSAVFRTVTHSLQNTVGSIVQCTVQCTRLSKPEDSRLSKPEDSSPVTKLSEPEDSRVDRVA